VISLRRDVGVFLFFLVVAVFGALKLAMSQALSAEEQPTTFRGTVVNSVTHAPIRRALVYSADNRFATLTDGEGHFEFALPKPENGTPGTIFESRPRQVWTVDSPGGPFWLMARKPGFLDDPMTTGRFP